MKVLVIEDHPKIRNNIIQFLTMSGYVAEGSIHGEDALEKISHNNYDILVLDVNMPVMNGKDFLLKIKAQEKFKHLPVLILTSNSGLNNTLEMFNLGADDYLVKPFELRELEVRLQSLFRRKHQEIEDIITFGDISIHLLQHKVLYKNVEIPLGNKHFLILEFLLKNRGRPQSKISILENVWGELEEKLDLNSTTLEAHISVIRKKMGKGIITTIKGVGYVME